MSSALLSSVVFVAATCASYVVLDESGARARRRASLQHLADYQLADYGERNEREQRQTDTLARRLLVPLAAWSARLGRNLTPSGYVGQLTSSLSKAGRRGSDALERFLAFQVVCLAAGLLGALVIATLVPFAGLTRIGIVALVLLGFTLGPRAALDRAVRERQRDIRLALPNFVDLLAVSVEAGFGLDQALERVSGDATGPLAEELRRLQGDMRAGASRAAAMRALLERTDVPELRSFVAAVLQTEAFGVPIAPVLRAQSQDMRIRRRQRAQAQAQKAPVKMLFPTVFCIFPALFVVVLGPAMINIGDSFR